MKFDVSGKLYTDFELQELAIDTLERAEAAEREAAALREQLAQAQATIGTLRAELVFEKSKQIGARYVIDETPFGQALDSLGDEVE